MSERGGLWIVDPSIYRAEEQGVQEIAARFEGETRVFRPGLVAGDGPCPADGYAAEGIVVMGSAASVHDGHGWIADLARWLEPVVRGEIDRPVLGICFGHQLIAHLAAGTVGYVHHDHAKLVGVATTRLKGSRLLPGRSQLRVVVSHREEVQQIPPGFRVVAERGDCRVDGLEHERRPIASFQFHPEAREEFARNAGIDEQRIDAEVRRDAGELIDAFLGWVALVGRTAEKR